MEKLIIVLFVLTSHVHYSTQRCIIGAGWKRLTMEERLVSAHSVVYGKTVQHLSNVLTMNGQTVSVIDALFEIYCIIKQGGENFEETIRIERIAPRDGCSGSKGNMQIGQEAFIALKPTSDGKYEYDEVMPALSAVFTATKSNFLQISSLCGLQSWTPPVDATVNRCPQCGVANFTDAISEEDDSSSSFSCLINGELVNSNSNSTACDVILASNTDADENCIPTSFSNTCTRLRYSFGDVNCVCTSNSRVGGGGGGYIDVSAGDQKQPFVLVHLCLVLISMFKHCFL